MAVSAIIKNGEVANIGKSYEETKAEAKSNSTVDKEQFLQLLVAQMQYQDPLEPTNNTEYVSQLATFSELEQMQNMSKSTDMARAQSLVGKTVTINSTNSATGVTTEITGKVESVVAKSSGSYVYVNGTLYELDDVVQVLDDEYASATDYSDTWTKMYLELPALGEITEKNAAQYKETVEKLCNAYDAMNEYQKKFIPDEMVTGLKEYVERMQSFGVVFGQDASAASGTATGTGSTGSTGSTGTEASGGSSAGTGTQTGTGSTGETGSTGSTGATGGTTETGSTGSTGTAEGTGTGGSTGTTGTEAAATTGTTPATETVTEEVAVEEKEGTETVVTQG